MTTTRMKKRRAKQARHTKPTVAEFDIATQGCLEVLSVGKGDLKIVIGGDGDDSEKARALITEMIRKGYAIFVETDEGLARVRRFNPNRMTYVISELAPELESGIVDAEVVDDDERAALPAPKPPAGKRKTRDRHVPVGGSRATAIGRTAGG